MNTQTQQVMFSSKSDLWMTPSSLFTKLDQAYNFTLDPCANSTNAKCVKYYDEQANGLIQDWTGEIVFVNPPYSDIASWVKKCHDEYVKNQVISVMLIPARTDTKYFHDYIMKADLIHFIKGRVKFDNGIDKPNSAPFPSMLVVFDPRLSFNEPQITSFIQ